MFSSHKHADEAPDAVVAASRFAMSSVLNGGLTLAAFLSIYFGFLDNTTARRHVIVWFPLMAGIVTHVMILAYVLLPGTAELRRTAKPIGAKAVWSSFGAGKAERGSGIVATFIGAAGTGPFFLCFIIGTFSPNTTFIPDGHHVNAVMVALCVCIGYLAFLHYMVIGRFAALHMHRA